MGPANDSPPILRELMLEGMSTARFNLSHGDHDSHRKKFALVSKLRKELKLPIATLLDTKGPEIRVKQFQDGRAELSANDIFVLTTQDVMGDHTKVSITYQDLPQDIQTGAMVLIDDGLIAMQVISTNDTDISCKVLNSGVVSNNKGINVPGTVLSMPYLSKQDEADLCFAVETGFDFVATSFTRTADDVLAVRSCLAEHGGQKVRIIAKIENAEGVKNIDEIIRVADGVMVARGDMGVEIPMEDVPIFQKMIIEKVYQAGKIVITATQMLESMIHHPRPTRAEANDIANAIYDGTSAIMLSGETAAGKYPVEALKTMVKIATRAEQEIDYIENFNRCTQSGKMQKTDIPDAISHATCTTAHDLGASAIVTVTHSGRTARSISRFRPDAPIIGCGLTEQVCRQLNLSWGVIPIQIQEKKDAEDLFTTAVDTAEKMGLIEAGTLAVITAGVPLGISGTTNMMKVQVVGHILITGTGVTQKSVCGNLCVCETEQEALKRFKEGDILVIPETTNRLIPLLRSARGLITEQAGAGSHAATIGMALDLAVIVGAENATKILKSNAVVYLNAKKGIVSSEIYPENQPQVATATQQSAAAANPQTSTKSEEA